MSQNTLLPRQKQAFCFCAFSAPAVAASSHLPWPWVLTLTILLAAVLLGLSRLREKRGDAPEDTLRVFGGFGKIMLLLQALFAVLLLWQFALGSVSAFPDDKTSPFVPLTLLAVSAWAACQGKEACARAVGVLFFLLCTLYLAVFFFALPEADFSRVLSFSENTDLLPLGVVLLLPFYGRYLSVESKKEGKGLGWLGAFILLPTLAALFCALVPGSGGKFYTMVKSVEILSFAQRMEPLVSVATTVGWFSALCLLLVSAGDLGHAALGIGKGNCVLLSCALAVPGVLWGKTVSPRILLPLGAVFCVFFPMLTQVFVRKKFS